MKHILRIVLTASVCLLVPVRAAESENTANAQAAATAWLALTDAGDYSGSWEQAAGLFQAAVSKLQWQTAMQGNRAPLGAVVARTLESATFTHSLPGAPDGEYVVIQYQTRFEHKASATETVTPLRESNGEWRVSGYFIR